jgi:hypothetical protein
MHRPFKIYLEPIGDGSVTRLRLSGSVATALPAREIRRLARHIWSWTGEPVELALPADKGSAEWFESWSYSISEIPARLLQVRFTLKRRRHVHGVGDVA